MRRPAGQHKGRCKMARVPYARTSLLGVLQPLKGDGELSRPIAAEIAAVLNCSPRQALLRPDGQRTITKPEPCRCGDHGPPGDLPLHKIGKDVTRVTEALVQRGP